MSERHTSLATKADCLQRPGDRPEQNYQQGHRSVLCRVYVPKCGPSVFTKGRC